MKSFLCVVAFVVVCLCCVQHSLAGASQELALSGSWEAQHFGLTSGQRGCGSSRPTTSFFYTHGKLMAFFAHPTARYLGSRVSIYGGMAYVRLLMKSRWTGKRLYVDLKLGLSSAVGVSSFSLERYNALFPPFAAMQLIKSFAIKYFQSELRNQSSGKRAAFLKGALAALNQLSGEGMCHLFLRYKWMFP